MKKRNLLVALVMSFVMLLSACGSDTSNKFIGKWIGTLDLTDHIVQEMVAQDASLEQYVKFENLTFTFIFEFTKTTVSLSVDEASTQQFIANAETGITNMIDAMVADMATENNETEEDVYAGMGVSREEFVETTIDSMQLDTMVATMVDALSLSGAYEINDDTITVAYEDNTYEEMKYVFGKEDLTITVSDGVNDFVICCEKSK